jgi:hypothetical protein
MLTLVPLLPFVFINSASFGEDLFQRIFAFDNSRRKGCKFTHNGLNFSSKIKVAAIALRMHILSLRAEKRMLEKLFGPALLIILAFSCLEEPECIGLNNNVVGISFINLDKEASDSVSFDSLFIDARKVIYIAKDPVTFTADDADTTIILSTMTLPLNYFQQQTRFVFGFGDNMDTLTLNYKSQAQFVSEDCGERYVISELTADGTGILDSIRVISGKPGTSTISVKNLQIYFE